MKSAFSQDSSDGSSASGMADLMTSLAVIFILLLAAHVTRVEEGNAKPPMLSPHTVDWAREAWLVASRRAPAEPGALRGFLAGVRAAGRRIAHAVGECLKQATSGAVIMAVMMDGVPGGGLGAATAEEFVRELAAYRSLEFQEGVWRPAPWKAMWMPRTMDFGPVFGRQYCVPMFLEEMRSLPELYPGLRRVGFYVGGLNWFVDWLVSPLALLAMRGTSSRKAAPASSPGASRSSIAAPTSSCSRTARWRRRTSAATSPCASTPTISPTPRLADSRPKPRSPG